MDNVYNKILYGLAAAFMLGAALMIAPLQSVAVENQSSLPLRDVVVSSRCGKVRVVELLPGQSLRHWIGWCGESTSQIELSLDGKRYRGLAGYFGRVGSTTLKLSVGDGAATLQSGLLVPGFTRTTSFSMSAWNTASCTDIPELPITM